MISTLVLSLPLVLPQEAPAPRALVDVSVSPQAAMELLARGLDVAHLDASSGTARLIVGEQERQELSQAGFAPRVVVEDLAAWYAARLDPAVSDQPGVLGAWLSPPFAQGSMGGNYGLSEVVSVLDQMTAAYPAICAPKLSIGQSLEGREMWMLKISDNPLSDEPEPEVRMDALHHAREPQSMQTTLWFMLYLLESYGTDPLPRTSWMNASCTSCLSSTPTATPTTSKPTPPAGPVAQESARQWRRRVRSRPQPQLSLPMGLRQHRLVSDPELRNLPRPECRQRARDSEHARVHR